MEHAIPQPSQMLYDENSSVRAAGANLMAQLADYSEFGAALNQFDPACTPTINVILPSRRLLFDKNNNVRAAGANLMKKLANHCESSVIPQFDIADVLFLSRTSPFHR